MDHQRTGEERSEGIRLTSTCRYIRDKLLPRRELSHQTGVACALAPRALLASENPPDASKSSHLTEVVAALPLKLTDEEN
jgi:hypothetical protein